jgi:hypothetical protein
MKYENIIMNIHIKRLNYISTHEISCGTVALYGLFIIFFSWQTIGLRISLDHKFAELLPRIRRTFQQYFSQQNAL